MLKIILITTIFTTTFLLLFFGLQQRKMKKEAFEINSGNKDRDISIKEYLEQIEEFFFQLRYIKHLQHGTYTFEPRGLSKVLNGNVIVPHDSLSIKYEGPRSSVRILTEILRSPGCKF